MNWLVYFRFDLGGLPLARFVECYSQAHIDTIMNIVRADFGDALKEYAIMYSQRRIQMKEAPNFAHVSEEEFLLFCKERRLRTEG